MFYLILMLIINIVFISLKFLILSYLTNYFTFIYRSRPRTVIYAVVCVLEKVRSTFIIL